MSLRDARTSRTVRRAERSESSSPFQPRNSDQRNRVYVGNLSWDTTWQALKDHMKSAGDVVRADVMSEAGGRSKGCGVVEFRTASEARRAIDELHDTMLNGRQIFVREDRDAGPSGIGKVFVGNLAATVTWRDLKDHMRAGGNVVHATIITDADQVSKGCAIVEYGSVNDARRAIRTLNSTVLHGRTLFVREDRDQEASADMGSNRVYVGNLAWNVQWYELKDHMKLAGNVLHVDIMQEPNGRSKGCALVEYATAEEAARAIDELNDTTLNDRIIFVREDRENGGSGSHSGRQLFVGNLWFRTTWYVLKDYFKTIGEVEYVDIPTDAEGRSRGFGTVRYTNAEDAQRAIDELSGTELEGRLIEVREDKMA